MSPVAIRDARKPTADREQTANQRNDQHDRAVAIDGVAIPTDDALVDDARGVIRKREIRIDLAKHTDDQQDHRQLEWPKIAKQL